MRFQYLQKIRKKFYFRVRVPSDLVEQIGVSELKRSLSTSDPQLAKVQAANLTYHAERLFCLIRANAIHEADLPAYLSDHFPLRRRKISTFVKPTRLSSAIKDFIMEKEVMGHWTSKTTEENTAILETLLDLIGDCELKSITRSMMIAFAKKLSSLPPNARKIARKKGVPISQLRTNPDGPVISNRSVNKHLNRIGSLMLWCVRQGYIIRNPAERLSIRMDLSADEEREAYDQQDLDRLIHALIKVRCDKPERFWIPIIALFSGLRLNEICQLYISDIVVVDGISCFDINAGQDKRVKTTSSRRVIPIHPELIELGLLSHVKRMNEEGYERLWPNLLKRRDGYIQLFVHWFTRFNRIHVTKNPKRTFHSTRHSFANNLKQQLVSENVISELLGHANESISIGRYGKRYQPHILLHALQRLDYGINLTVLRSWDGRSV